MLPRYGLFVVACLLVSGSSLPATYDQRQTGELNVHVHVNDLQVLALLGSDLLDDYTEYDYFYDYADFTIKPTVKPTTSTTASSAETTEKIDVAVDSPSTTEEAVSSSGSTEKTEADSSLGSTEKTDVSTIESLQNLTASTEPSNLNSSLEDANVSPASDIKANETSTTSLSESVHDSISSIIQASMKMNDKTRNLFKDDDEDIFSEQSSGVPMENSNKRMLRKRCRSGYSPDGKGRCRRLSQRRLSLLPLAMKFTPKLLDDRAYGVKNVAQ